MTNNTLGPYLRSLREKTGCSLRSTATFLGISAPYLSDIECGNRNIPVRRIPEFAVAYGCGPEDILKHHECSRCGGSEKYKMIAIRLAAALMDSDPACHCYDPDSKGYCALCLARIVLGADMPTREP